MSATPEVSWAEGCPARAGRALPGLRPRSAIRPLPQGQRRLPACGAELHHHRADDLPPYLVILIVAHLVGWGILTAETRFEVPLWLHLAVWPALTVMLSLLLLQPVKGAVVGLQYGLSMHGFSAARRRGG